MRALVVFFNDRTEMNFSPKGQSSNVERPSWKAHVLVKSRNIQFEFIAGCSHIDKHLNDELRHVIINFNSVEDL